ncbi:inositol oxygenase [Tieghemostelium lacteum]|uniref:Inositol oxygenase n=1 Tax=Tieghemostelium lacteum TaxID=361077 RepID=A0A151ZCR4_TIELA|nr:inositol oxygenase [Tieghemostelium lacteum]|eukprot:KYQ91664.1 inositol oxygenase [Tieghemostelium lacteum]
MLQSPIIANSHNSVTSTNSTDNGADVGFEMVKDKEAFRNYKDGELLDTVSRSYRNSHTFQTYAYALEKKNKYARLDSGIRMSIWEAAELLNSVVDESDPDSGIPQINHLLQTAEAIRKVYPGEEYDWFHLVGFIHDLGKILITEKFGGQPQWAVVGDTFPLGCPFDPSNIFFDFFKDNPDWSNPLYNTGNGIYPVGCGLENVIMSWGHDEYFYQVCLGNDCLLPKQALYMIRFHSFYPWHRAGQYKSLTNQQDEEMLKWVKEFNLFDLYSKDPEPINVDKLKPYYQSLIKKYFPNDILNW